MTTYQTRQLGIEFERRVQTILPATESVAKLDTETIYSFLNQYQQKYVHDIYKQVDTIEPNTNLVMRAEKILQPLLNVEELTGGTSQDSTILYITSPDCEMYVRSISNVTSTYNWSSSDSSTETLPNTFATQSEAQKLMSTPHDKLRIIRYPIAIFTPRVEDEDDSILKPTLTIIHDRYTNIASVTLYYYKKPLYFDIMTSTPCELPMDCFDDLVTGAVELYISYVRGGIRQQEEDGRRERAAQRHADREAELERKNDREQ